MQLASLTILLRFASALVLPHPRPTAEVVLPPTDLDKRAVDDLLDDFLAESARRMKQEPTQAVLYQLAAVDLSPHDVSMLQGVARNVAQFYPDLAIDLYRRARKRGLPADAVKMVRTQILRVLGKETYTRYVKENARLDKELVLPELPPPTVTVPFATFVLEYEESEDDPESPGGALPGRAERAAMVEGILQAFREATDSKSGDGRTLNNLFYDHQMKAYRATGKPLLSTLPGFDKLERAFRASAVDLLRRVGVEDAEIKHRVRKSLSVFASVHITGSTHGTHTHMGDVASGVFYLQAPENSGRLVFRDPRSSNAVDGNWKAKPPFHRPFAVEVREGKLYAWPGWLPHAVEHNGVDEGQYRVSVTYDLEGDWHETASAAIQLNAGSRAASSRDRKSVV